MLTSLPMHLFPSEVPDPHVLCRVAQLQVGTPSEDLASPFQRFGTHSYARNIFLCSRITASFAFAHRLQVSFRHGPHRDVSLTSEMVRRGSDRELRRWRFAAVTWRTFCFGFMDFIYFSYSHTPVAFKKASFSTDSMANLDPLRTV